MQEEPKEQGRAADAAFSILCRAQEAAQLQLEVRLKERELIVMAGPREVCAQRCQCVSCTFFGAQL
jgi:hypothetical protein